MFWSELHNSSDIILIEIAAAFILNEKKKNEFFHEIDN